MTTDGRNSDERERHESVEEREGQFLSSALTERSILPSPKPGWKRISGMNPLLQNFRIDERMMSAPPSELSLSLSARHCSSTVSSIAFRQWSIAGVRRFSGALCSVITHMSRFGRVSDAGGSGMVVVTRLP